MDLERLRAELTQHEPREHRGFLMVPREGRLYAAGSGVPRLGLARVREARGLFEVGERQGPAPIDYFGVYLTLDEYAPVVKGMNVKDLIGHWNAKASEKDLLIALAILNRAFNDDDLRQRLISEFGAELQPDVRTRFENLVTTGGHERRWFLARQPILMAMREVLTRPPVDEPEDGMPPLLAATLLVHTVAMGLNAEPRAGDQTIGGHPAHLAMEIVRNELFHAGEDTFALIDRHVRLWRDFGARVTTPAPRAAPVELLSEAAGTDLIALLAAGFGLWAYISAWEPWQPYPLPKPIAPGLVDDMAAVLRLLARTPEEFRAVLEAPRSSWDLLAFQETPLLDLADALVVLDEDYLLDHVTTGLYWVVHDHERDRSDDDRHRWTQVYGAMIELQMEESIDALALPLLGSGATAYSEEDVARAYPGKVTDRVVDRGDTFLLVEVVSGRLTVRSRIDGDVEAFKADTEKLAIKKVRQLDETGRAIAADRGAALTGSHRDVPLRMLPVVVVAGGFGGYPVNPTTVEYVREWIKAESLLDQWYFDSLCIIDTGELELLQGLNERGHDPVELLRRWQGSSLWRMPFKNWVLNAINAGDPSLRPSRMNEHGTIVFEEIRTRLGLKSDDEESS